MLYKKKYLKYKYKYLQLKELLEGGTLSTLNTAANPFVPAAAPASSFDTFLQQQTLSRLRSAPSKHTMLSSFAYILNRMTHFEIVPEIGQGILQSYDQFLDTYIKEPLDAKPCIYIIDYANIAFRYTEELCIKLLEDIYNMLTTGGIVFIISKATSNPYISIEHILNIHTDKQKFNDYISSNHLNIFNINIPDKALRSDNPIDDLFFWFIATSCFLTLHYSNILPINAIKLITRDTQRYDTVIFSGPLQIINTIVIEKIEYNSNGFFKYYPSQNDSIIFKNFLNLVEWDIDIYLFDRPTNILQKQYYTNPRYTDQKYLDKPITISDHLQYDHLFYNSLHKITEPLYDSLHIDKTNLFGQCVNQIIAQIFNYGTSVSTHRNYFIKINEFFNGNPKKYNPKFEFTYDFFNTKKEVIVYKKVVFDIRDANMTYSLYFMCLFKYIHYILTQPIYFNCTGDKDDVNQPYQSLIQSQI